MGLKSQRSPAEGEFRFEIDPEPLEESVTALGGLPLFLWAVRRLDVPGSVKRHLRLKQRERGLEEAAYVESFLTLNAVGGVCLEDFNQLREAADVTQMAGYPMPSAEAPRKFLYRFHEEELVAARPKRLRFLIFHTPGKLVQHARQTILRLTRSLNRFSNWQGALRLLPLPD